MMFMQLGVKQNEKQLWYQSHYEPYKDNLVWRIMLNVKEVSKEMQKIPRVTLTK